MKSLEAMKKRLNRATPGPWEIETEGETLYISASNTMQCIAQTQGEFDADFIAHSREDMERLIAAVEVMRSKVEEAISGTSPCTDRRRVREALAEADKILEGK